MSCTYHSKENQSYQGKEPPYDNEGNSTSKLAIVVLNSNKNDAWDKNEDAHDKERSGDGYTVRAAILSGNV